MRPGELRSTISKDLPEERQRFANALRDMYDSIPAVDGRRTSQSKLLKAMEASYASRSSLCRYLQGKNLPTEDFVQKFHKAISELTTGILPLTCEELLSMRQHAEGVDGRRRTARQASAVHKLDEAERRIDELGVGNATPIALPVPRETGDRQGNKFAGRPAPQAATEVIQLAKLGQYEQTVTLLSRLSEHLDTDELALSVAHLRAEQYDDLADTLVQICGREDQRQVIRLSITLREHQLPGDADALLRMII
ncbi:hypothetical protein BAY61_00100 [Prauserella marina]|uniref:Uncharacterized protein n=1 Tax=Prauserella marina TaxID=530584 RepID=A0A222VIV9_9PSEU|nr:hypothetical protein [Prauserella marina]ASR33651.1 hypothetical protein BAY61_00100 [Prauserella marina]PWV82194.1 hypothetical protein DES30_102432 [Prauserella marina]SDD21346.1 hypothetical protein SAMN05421630_106432 [Prauserella marina]